MRPRTVTLRVLRTLQLAAALILCVAGILTLLPAPNYDLWAVAVVASIYGHYFMMAAILGFLPALRRGWAGRTSLALSWIGAVCAVAPAVFCATQVQERVQGPGLVEAPNLRQISLPRLFFGALTPAIVPKTWVYSPAYDLKLDVYLPPAPQKATSTLLIVHGGAWEGSDRQEFLGLNSYMAARGTAVVAVDYRLAPKWRYPAALDDVESAIRYVQTHQAELGLPLKPLTLMGRSAGGHLALLAAYRAPVGQVNGVISLYGPTDLGWGWEHPRNPAVIDSQDVLRQFLGGSLEDVPELYQQASPLSFVRAGLPPTLLIHGSRDDQVSPEQGERLASALASAGAPFAYLSLPLTNHAYDFNFDGVAAQVATHAIETFAASVNGP